MAGIKINEHVVYQGGQMVLCDGKGAIKASHPKTCRSQTKHILFLTSDTTGMIDDCDCQVREAITPHALEVNNKSIIR